VTTDWYILGVCAAIAAGIAFNLGMLIQKIAVGKAGKDSGLMRRLVKSPLWLSGFALQFLIGTPLNMLAQAHIGPAIIPGLMAVGLAVLAVGAVKIAKEAFTSADVFGILLVGVSTALFGLSGLGVDMKSVRFYEPAFLGRLIVFTLAVGILSLACHILQKMIPRLRGLLRIVNAGLLFSESNLWLGVLMVFLPKLGGPQFTGWDLLPIGAASTITFACSMLGIAETQRAFQYGEASKLVPIQSVPSQILPVVSYFAVFKLAPPNGSALPLTVAAVAFILAGSVLLARRQVQ
jgi:hypothetical protein